MDFFTPVVDDPYLFGKIAAANSLSDVYAMGGHSVEDTELKYGLSVTGFVHPDKILTNQGLRDGDQLILTKPIGTGIINTAIKGGLASAADIREVTRSMETLNKVGAEIMRNFAISACTDVTGFGLLGHLAEMVQGQPVKVTLFSSHIPILTSAYDLAAMGLVPVGAYKNRKHREKLITLPDNFDPVQRDILFDPQTSGGLLFGCRQSESTELLTRLHDAGVTDAAIIGEAAAAPNAKIIVEQ